MTKECITGIDIGTSACKSIIVDKEGNLLASATEEYTLYTPHAGWAEQNPSDWWNATISTIYRLKLLVAAKKTVLSVQYL